MQRKFRKKTEINYVNGTWLQNYAEFATNGGKNFSETVFSQRNVNVTSTKRKRDIFRQYKNN